MPHVGRSEPLVNSMNSVARMTHVRLRLRHCESVPSKASHNSYSGTMKTDVPKTEATEELMPFFRSIFWQHNEMGSALFLREPVKRHKVSVHRRGMNAASFCHKADCSRAKIDVVHGRAGFGNSTPLAHRYEPRFSHPGILVEQCRFDGRLFADRDFGFFPWRCSAQSQADTRIRCDVTTTDGLLHDRGENLELGQRGIERARADSCRGRLRSKLRVLSAVPVSNLEG